MTYSREEIDKAITELKRTDLYIAKQLSQTLCTMDYNMSLRFFTGEEFDKYTKLWKKRLEDTRKEIEDSSTVAEALDIGFKFDEELLAYVKATKVGTADKAMDIAHSFIKKYVPVALPMKAVKQGNVWNVDVDVGALAVKVAKVKVDARTGDILSYEIPEK